MRVKFLKPNDPRLRKVTKKIPLNQIDSPRTREIIQTMLDTAYGRQKDKKKPIMVGLAAPQIGILKRIILVDVKADGKSLPAGRQGKVGDLRIYINPKIIWKSKRKGEWYEGCFSTGRICGIVSRPVSVKIKAYTTSFPLATSFPLVKWERRLEKYSGYVARIFQHEINHLNGQAFIDHIKNPANLHWVFKKEFHLYRNKQAWKNWPKKYPLPLAINKLKKV